MFVYSATTWTTQPGSLERTVLMWKKVFHRYQKKMQHIAIYLILQKTLKNLFSLVIFDFETRNKTDVKQFEIQVYEGIFCI